MKHRKTLKRAAVPAALLLMSAGGLSALASTAVFGSEDAPASNVFTAGTVDITTAPATSIISMSNMAPGDAQYGTVTVTNSGTLEHRYALRASVKNTGPGALSDAIMVTVKENVTSCSAAGFAATGITLAQQGPLTALAIGDPARGQQAGDRIMGAQQQETLCIKAELPAGASDQVQGSATTATFTFSAEQTRNNK